MKAADPRHRVDRQPSNSPLNLGEDNRERQPPGYPGGDPVTHIMHRGHGRHTNPRISINWRLWWPYITVEILVGLGVAATCAALLAHSMGAGR